MSPSRIGLVRLLFDALDTASELAGGLAAERQLSSYRYWACCNEYASDGELGCVNNRTGTGFVHAEVMKAIFQLKIVEEGKENRKKNTLARPAFGFEPKGPGRGQGQAELALVSLAC